MAETFIYTAGVTQETEPVLGGITLSMAETFIYTAGFSLETEPVEGALYCQ